MNTYDEVQIKYIAHEWVNYTSQLITNNHVICAVVNTTLP